MAFKQYKAIVYIQVEDTQAEVMEAGDVQDYCLNAVKLDLDTEEYGNPCGVTKVEIDWATFANASELEK